MRDIRTAVIVVLLLLTPYVVASMAAPEVVPRVGLLPQPAGEVHYIESARKGGPHYAVYTSWQHGLFWEHVQFTHGDGCMPILD